MASQRWFFLCLPCLLLLPLLLLVHYGAAASSNMAPYSSPFVPEWQDKYLRNTKWLLARRLLKRTDEDLETEILQFSDDQVEAATRGEYKAMPHSVLFTSRLLHNGVNCSAVHSNLHDNHINLELQLRPDWIHTSELIGDCPTHYVTRELPPTYSPSVVLEAVCSCGESQCSQDGHQCVPVSRHVPVWVRRGPNFHVMDVEELTIACACVRRPSASGNFVYSAAVQS